MPYATATELVIAFGARELAQIATPKRFDVVNDEELELAIDAGSGAGFADEVALDACLDAINQALAVADGIIDSYISTRYSIPLASTPAALREVALDLSRFELFRERATEDVKDRRNMAIAWLKDISKGVAKIGDATLDSGTGKSGISIVPSDGRTFTNETLDSFDWST